MELMTINTEEKMKIQILEFYPPHPKVKHHKNYFGGIKVHIIDDGIYLSGISLNKTPKGFFVRLPSRAGTRHEDDKKCFYPVFLYGDEEKNQALRDAIRDQLNTFLPKWFSEHPDAMKKKEAPKKQAPAKNAQKKVPSAQKQKGKGKKPSKK